MRVKDWIKRGIQSIPFPIVSLFLGALVMYMMLSYAGVLTTGKYCLLEGDALEIYVPTIRSFCRAILQGDSFYYSWSNSLGMGTALSLAYYSCFSPFTLLYLIFYQADTCVVTAAVIIIKAGLAAMAFQIFSNKVLKSERIISVVFSVFYSLCSFQVSFNIVNFIWMDALFVLPLLLTALYKLSKDYNPIPLCLLYAYSFITQFYMGYIVGITSFLFFLGFIWIYKDSIRIRKYVFSYISSVILAIMLSAFVWMPALLFLINHSAEDASVFRTIKINILDIINQFFFSNNTTIYSELPNVYCGILALILLPKAFLNLFKGLKMKKKTDENKWNMVLCILLVVLVVACLVSPVFMMFHAFDYPDGWMYRFSWAISFVVCSLATKTASNLEKTDLKYYMSVYVILAGIYIFELFWIKKRMPDEVVNTWLFFLINMVVMAVWISVLLFMKKAESKQKQLWMLAILLTAFECIGNGYVSYHKDQTRIPLREYVFYTFEENQSYMLDYLGDDTSFYRVNYAGDNVINSDSYSGFNGLSDFNTAENPAVRKVLSQLGFATSPRLVLTDGSTPVSDMLLGVKYRITGSVPQIIATYSQEPIIDDNELNLSLGYMASESIYNCKFEKSAFANNNELLSSIVGKRVTVFHDLDKDCIETVSNGVSIEKDGNGYVLTSQDDGDNTIEFIVSKSDVTRDDESYYFYITNDISRNWQDSMRIEGEMESRSENGGLVSMSYIKKMDFAAEEEVAIIKATKKMDQHIADYGVATLDQTELEKIYNDISKNQLQILEISNGIVRGNVQSTREKTVLFTTIPYEDGWTLFVDGKEQDIVPLLEGAFIGVEFDTPGTHEIALKYHVNGLKEGVILSCLGLLGVLTAIVIYYRRLLSGMR